MVKAIAGGAADGTGAGAGSSSGYGGTDVVFAVKAMGVDGEGHL